MEMQDHTLDDWTGDCGGRGDPRTWTARYAALVRRSLELEKAVPWTDERLLDDHPAPAPTPWGRRGTPRGCPRP